MYRGASFEQVSPENIKSHPLHLPRQDRRPLLDDLAGPFEARAVLAARAERLLRALVAAEELDERPLGQGRAVLAGLCVELRAGSQPPYTCRSRTFICMWDFYEKLKEYSFFASVLQALAPRCLEIDIWQPVVRPTQEVYVSGLRLNLRHDCPLRSTVPD